jgi:hypothetical protein
MTSLDKIKIKNLLEKYSKEELAEQLAFYKDLEYKGNVYYENIPKYHYSVRQLILMVSKFNENVLKNLLDCSFNINKKKQSRTMKKYNINKTLLNLAGGLARQYKTEFKSSAPRIKKTKDTSELLDCHSQMSNCYPASYKKYVEKFIENHPIEKWHIDEFDDKFNEIKIDNEVKYSCKNCEKNLKKNSRKQHLKNCKGKSNE